MSAPHTSNGGTRRGRAGAGVVVVVAHLIAAAWLLRAAVPPVPPPRLPAIAVHAVPAAPEPAAAPVFTSVPVPVDLSPPPSDSMIPVEQPPSCSIVDSVAAALSADPAAAAELVPAAGQAHAVMVWDGRWTAAWGSSATHKALLTALSTAAAPCLDEPMQGPRLVFVGVAGAVLSVAIGSGSWRWRDLLSNDRYLPETAR